MLGDLLYNYNCMGNSVHCWSRKVSACFNKTHDEKPHGNYYN